VRETFEAIALVQVAPVQVTDVREQVDAVVVHQPRGEVEHLAGALEHVQPALPQLVRVERPRGHRRDAVEHLLAGDFATLVGREVHALEPARQVRHVDTGGGQVVDEALVAQPQQHAAHVEHHVADHGAPQCGRQPSVASSTANPTK